MTIEAQLNNANPEVTPENTITVDVTEDVNALITGEELSEEFKGKAATIFEAAVVSRVKSELETRTAKLEESFDQRVSSAVEEKTQGIIENIDGYLDYLAEQWINDNELALESGMRSEILEGFLKGLKGLFEENYIDLPEDQINVVEGLEAQISELKSSLAEQSDLSKSLQDQLNESAKSKLVAEIAEELTDTEKEKFSSLAEEIAFTTAEEFGTKLKTIKESYFPKTKTASSLVESVVSGQPIVEETTPTQKQIDPSVSLYVQALDKTKR